MSNERTAAGTAEERQGDSPAALRRRIRELESELAMARHRERIHAQLLESIGQAVIATDAEGRIVVWNAAACELYGWKAEEVLGRHILDITPAGEGEARAAEIMEELRRGQSWSGEIRLVDRDGRAFVAEVVDRPVFDEEGRVVGVVGLSREAGDVETARANFLAVVSHELRTPLNAIMGYVDLLCAGIDGPLSEPQQRHLERVHASARLLHQLLEEVLAYARAEAGREPVLLEDVGVRAACEEVIAGVRGTADQKGLTLDLRVEEPDLSVCTDGRKLRQVLLNLVSNAVRFTERGGVTVDVHGSEGGAAFHVTDTGVGIRPENLERIFEPFWQVEHPNTRTAGGTGLGLGMARRLARLLGGDVAVESTPREGSRFTLWIPDRARA